MKHNDHTDRLCQQMLKIDPDIVKILYSYVTITICIFGIIKVSCYGPKPNDFLQI